MIDFILLSQICCVLVKSNCKISIFVTSYFYRLVLVYSQLSDWLKNGLVIILCRYFRPDLKTQQVEQSTTSSFLVH